MREALGFFGKGLGNFLASLSVLILWCFVIMLPVVMLTLILPDYMEGKAAGSGYVQGFSAACLLAWGSVISARAGTLKLVRDSRRSSS